MAKKGKGFFPRSNKETEKEKKEFITWGAAWMYGGEDGYDLPYFSLRINKEDIESMLEYSESTEDGNVNCMMFSNNNQREGHKDPDYYLVPPRDSRK